jgi:hypothetical protein
LSQKTAQHKCSRNNPLLVIKEKILNVYFVVCTNLLCSPSLWFLFVKIFYCCAGGTLLHFQKFLQYIKHVILNSLTLSFSISLSPDSWNSFNRSHFSIYIQVYTLFLVYSCSYKLSLQLPPLHCYHPCPWQDLYHPSVLWFDFNRLKNSIFIL